MAIRSNFSQLSFITEIPGEGQRSRGDPGKITLSCEKERVQRNSGKGTELGASAESVDSALCVV